MCGACAYYNSDLAQRLIGHSRPVMYGPRALKCPRAIRDWSGMADHAPALSLDYIARLKRALDSFQPAFFIIRSTGAIEDREVLQTEFRYDFRKGLREISADTTFTVLKAKMHVSIVKIVPVEISRRPFQKSYRNSVCKTSLMSKIGKGRYCELQVGNNV